MWFPLWQMVQRCEKLPREFGLTVHSCAMSESASHARQAGSKRWRCTLAKWPREPHDTQMSATGQLRASWSESIAPQMKHCECVQSREVCPGSAVRERVSLRIDSEAARRCAPPQSTHVLVRSASL